ncbi:MAG TPA: TIGR03620 family F420-dependent LLM class oxidoreductase [Stellaceae bacterium]|jgi:probable F420-dependent oxidoreductase|nr:TIGR03620 family F420-dependent LLM class oxidoreductase [Stellaceae bacterium]
MQLGKLGVWVAMDLMTAAQGAAFAQRVEGWGYAALWLPESRGRNVMVHSSWLLANTKSLIVAPGIANIYARDAMAMANGQRALAEQSGGRFLLGVGVSHVPSVEGLRGHTYGKPVTTMRTYLDAMNAASYGAPPPAEKPLTIVAALGPRMMALSGSHADGAHPYNVTPEHTHEARRILGPGKLLCPEIWVLLESDAATARALGRQALANYLRLENYVNNWRRLGFTDDDFTGGGSARFIDANVAWGDEGAIRKRIQEHWDAGADHVCIQSISPDGSRRPDEQVLGLLAPGLKATRAIA